MMRRTNIHKLQNIINKNKEDYAVISPSFQWAQGKTDVQRVEWFRRLVENEHQAGSQVG